MKLALVFALALPFLACQSQCKAPEPEEGGWSGPPVDVDVTGEGGVKVLRFSLTAPFAGHRFETNHVEHADGVAHVFATLREPAPSDRPSTGEGTPEELSIELTLEEDVSAVELSIASWIDGVNYVQQPPFELAARIDVIEAEDSATD